MAASSQDNKASGITQFRLKSNKLYYCYLFLFILFSIAIIPSLFTALSTYNENIVAVRTSTPSRPITIKPLLKRNTKHRDHQVTTRNSSSYSDDACDMFTGEWVPNPDGRHYTSNCTVIREHHSCFDHGRPDMGFLNWKWRPTGRGCGGGDLPEFDPVEFLQTVKGKSMAFVGDSIARGQLQSLICLLWDVEHPEEVKDKDFNPRWRYKSNNFTLAIFWSPYLVRSHQDKPTATQLQNHYIRLSIHLDEPDPAWISKIHAFDYLIISAGQWFFNPLYYYQNGQPIGCTYSCDDTDGRNVTTVYSLTYGYRAAFHTTFEAILEKGFNGTVFLRTFSPSHFEGGSWDKGGHCSRKEPRKSGEISLNDRDKEFYLAQVEEFDRAKELGRGMRMGIRFRLLDVTKAMLLRPDGHPNKYRSDPSKSDCVHWCLPGPIDYWNTFLLQMIKRFQILAVHKAP